MEAKQNIILISGSIREHSYTRALTEFVTKALQGRGVDAYHWDLRERPLPIMTPKHREDVENHPDRNVRDFAARVDAADAVVFASPIYHNSYSGVLKNAIDHLRNPHFAYKPIGLLSHGGGGSKQAVDHLRIVARAVNAVATPTIVCTGGDDYEDFQLTSDSVVSRVDRFCDELIDISVALAPVRDKRTVKNK